MFKCPKCGFESAEAGNCPTDNEVLVAVEVAQAPAVEPQASTDKEAPAAQ